MMTLRVALLSLLAVKVVLADLRDFPALPRGTQASSAVVKKTYRVRVDELRPTQLAYGPEEVRERAEKLKKKSPAEIEKYIEKKKKAIVVGPEGQLFLVDGHHLARMLHELGLPEMLVTVLANRAEQSEPDFYRETIAAKQMYLFDIVGERQLTPEELPLTVAQLSKDPYRDLPWALQESGDILEVKEPFIEFEWARLLFRKHFRPEELADGYKPVLQRARTIARSEEARRLFTGRGYRPLLALPPAR